MDVSVIRDLLATLLSTSLAHALVQSLESSASHDYLTQVFKIGHYIVAQNKVFAVFQQRLIRRL
jgi:hypothetical protein